MASYSGQHGHLPGVPSAREVVEQGVDAMKMSALLLEKVEESTLYSIQLEKANQQQVQTDELKQMGKQLLEKK